jgi:hypothetical protein
MIHILDREEMATVNTFCQMPGKKEKKNNPANERYDFGCETK